MKFSHIFIKRPIFAAVLSVLILIVGGLAYITLPISQFPEVAPPTVEVAPYIRVQMPRFFPKQ